MRTGRKNYYDEYAQWEKNNTVAFALASMMFGEFTHVTVRRRVPGHGIEHLGGGDPVRVMKKFGEMHIESSMVTPEGLLQITVK